MTETVMMPTQHAPRPRGNGFIIPLLVVPFVHPFTTGIEIP